MAWEAVVYGVSASYAVLQQIPEKNGKSCSGDFREITPRGAVSGIGGGGCDVWGRASVFVSYAAQRGLQMASRRILHSQPGKFSVLHCAARWQECYGHLSFDSQGWKCGVIVFESRKSAPSARTDSQDEQACLPWNAAVSRVPACGTHWKILV